MAASPLEGRICVDGNKSLYFSSLCQRSHGNDIVKGLFRTWDEPPASQMDVSVPVQQGVKPGKILEPEERFSALGNPSLSLFLLSSFLLLLLALKELCTVNNFILLFQVTEFLLR